MPVLELGGEKSFGSTMAVVMRSAATHVFEGIVPDSGHWIMEENPVATTKMVRSFLDSNAGLERLTAPEIRTLPVSGAGPGTSGVAGIQTTVLAGDPTKAGPYAIALRVPPNTQRTAAEPVVVYIFGYGPTDTRYSRPQGVAQTH